MRQLGGLHVSLHASGPVCEARGRPSLLFPPSLQEAGHMLVAYLVGICPRAYTLSSWDAFSK